MKTIIAGSRNITAAKSVEDAIKESGFEITEVVCGSARGVDTLGELWAKANKIPVRYFPAEWKKFGLSAGHKRNAQMAEYAEALILVWDGRSKGSKSMRDLAEKTAEKRSFKIYEKKIVVSPRR